MGMKKLTVELPEDVVALLGPTEDAGVWVRETIVFDLLRQARIGQSLAAQLLGITRWDLLDRMVERQISSGPETEEETRREIEQLRRTLSSHPLHGGR